MTAPTYRSRCQTTGATGEPCTHAVELERLREDMGRAVGALSALTASQANEIRSLSLELARERKKRVGW